MHEMELKSVGHTLQKYSDLVWTPLNDICYRAFFPHISPSSIELGNYRSKGLMNSLHDTSTGFLFRPFSEVNDKHGINPIQWLGTPSPNVMVRAAA